MTTSGIGFVERVCVLALGIFIGRATLTWDAPRELIPVYGAIAASLLAARWLVVRYRDRRDAKAR